MEKFILNIGGKDREINFPVLACRKFDTYARKELDLKSALSISQYMSSEDGMTGLLRADLFVALVYFGLGDDIAKEKITQDDIYNWLMDENFNFIESCSSVLRHFVESHPTTFSLFRKIKEKEAEETKEVKTKK